MTDTFGRAIRHHQLFGAQPVAHENQYATELTVQLGQASETTPPLPPLLLGSWDTSTMSTPPLQSWFKSSWGAKDIAPPPTVTLHSEGRSSWGSDTALHPWADGQELHPQRKWPITQQQGPNRGGRLFLSSQGSAAGTPAVTGHPGLGAHLSPVLYPVIPDLPQPSAGS